MATIVNIMYVCMIKILMYIRLNVCTVCMYDQNFDVYKTKCMQYVLYVCVCMYVYVYVCMYVYRQPHLCPKDIK